MSNVFQWKLVRSLASPQDQVLPNSVELYVWPWSVFFFFVYTRFKFGASSSCIGWSSLCFEKRNFLHFEFLSSVSNLHFTVKFSKSLLLMCSVG